MLCFVGEFLNETLNICWPCPDGTYNSAAGRNVYCEPCTETWFPYSHIVNMCTKTHDIIWSCDEGYVLKSPNHKICIKDKRFSPKAVTNFTDSITSNSVTREQAFNSVTTDSPTTTDQNCDWRSWLSVWSCISPGLIVAIMVIFLVGVCVTILLLYFFYRKKSNAKHQQANAAKMPDPEGDPLIEEQQQTFPAEQHVSQGDEESQRSTVSDESSSLDHVNSGGSGPTGVPGSDLEMVFPNSVRSTIYDRPGHTSLPSSSLCEMTTVRSQSFSISLRDDRDDQTPSREVAESAGYNI